MKLFPSKLNKLSHEHLRDIATLSGAVAVLLIAAAFISVGGFTGINNTLARVGILPSSTQTANIEATQIGNWVYSQTLQISTPSDSCAFFYALLGIPCPPTLSDSITTTPGSAVTLYWDGYRYAGNTYYPVCDGFVEGDASSCAITANVAHFPSGCQNNPLFPALSTGDCGNVTSPGGGTASTYVVNPPVGTTNYYLCSTYLRSAAGFGCTYVTITVPGVVAPTTLTSVTATPSSITGSGTSRIDWVGVKGTNFNSCELAGGQWGSGTFFNALPGNVTTNTLTQTTTYSVDCFDTNGASTGWKSAIVTVTATPPPSGPCTDIPAQQTVPSGCNNPTPPPGVCIPTGGTYSATTNSCSCPNGTSLQNGACVVTPLCANGLNNSYAPSCKCPAGQYQPLGASSCVALPVCANGLSQAYSPSCTCPAGQVQVKNGSTCTQPGTISFSVTPNRVQKGNPVTVTWSTTNMSNCSLSELSAAGTSNPSLATSGTLNPAINSQTIFTLNCVDNAGESINASQTVNLIPDVIEK